MRTLRVALVQVEARDDVADNVARASALAAEAAAGSDLVILPEYVPSSWWEHLLHNQTALRLKAALLFHPGVVVANVPYHMATKHVGS